MLFFYYFYKEILMYGNITSVISSNNNTLAPLFNTKTTTDNNTDSLLPIIISLSGVLLVIGIIMSWYTRKCTRENALTTRSSISLATYRSTRSVETIEEDNNGLDSIETYSHDHNYHALTIEDDDDDLEFLNVKLQWIEETDPNYRHYVLNNMEGEEMDDNTAFQISSVRLPYQSNNTQKKL
ncbi:hypothetical protein IMW63_04025 [Ehrlichia ruminantium]|nr:hypothetical protein IMW63_04025 [Ehrlichia ruminantium]